MRSRNSVGELRNLPARLRNRPDIRALTLRVYETDDPRRFQVPGRERIYEIFSVGGAQFCNCRAGIHGHECAHAIAVGNYISSLPKEP